MWESYMDIKSRINERPKWFDSNGVPRYAKFSPDMCPDIYADEVILMEIACQDCGMRFLVEMHYDKMAAVLSDREYESISKRISRYVKAGFKGWVPIHYGDPPQHGCIGDTMNVYDLKIMEFWYRPKHEKGKHWERWKREPKYEIELEKEGDD